MKAFAVAVAVLAAVAIGVSAAPKWTVKNENFATIATDISCVSEQLCIAPVGVNGQGSFIWLTRDGGNTWQPEQEPFELMFLGAAMQGNSAVVADELSLLYNNATTPGQYVFGNPKSGDYLCESQNVEAFAGTYYGAAGGEDLTQGNGACVSADSGASWSFYNASVLKTFSRYGAYPSTSTWYLSAGEWPENDREIDGEVAEDDYDVTKRIRINRRSFTRRILSGGEVDAPAVPGWKAQIVKSTDGGKTWVSQFFEQDTFYFNQIGCTDENHCCAVGEADSDSDVPGVRFYCTWDGTNWSRTNFVPDPSGSLSVLSFRWVSATEGWAGGGSLSNFDFKGYFWHTLDGGHTWSNVTLNGMYANEITMVNANFGFATAFDVEGASALLQYS